MKPTDDSASNKLYRFRFHTQPPIRSICGVGEGLQRRAKLLRENDL